MKTALKLSPEVLELRQQAADRINAEAAARAAADDQEVSSPAETRRWIYNPNPKPKAANDNGLLPVIDPTGWQGVPVPERKWFIPGLIPGRTVTLLAGDGGLGKSLLAIQIGVASALALPTLGLTPVAGHVLYVGAEDEADEFHRRMAAIVDSHGRQLGDLEGRFLLVPLADRDAVLAAPDQTGKIERTTLFISLVKKVAEFRPNLIVLDTSADLFGGDEIKRSQVRQFVGMLRAVAMEHDCAVLLLAHPSVAGILSGSGTSGSTAWNNSVRSRLYLTEPTGADADSDQRVLTTMKSNYGKKGDVIPMRWQEGVLVLDAPGTANPARSMMDAEARRVFLDLLSKMNRQGQRVGSATGTSYAPAKMAKHPDAKGQSKAALERAMHRLLDDGTVKSVSEGPPSRSRQRLVISAESFGPS